MNPTMTRRGKVVAMLIILGFYDEEISVAMGISSNDVYKACYGLDPGMKISIGYFLKVNLKNTCFGYLKTCYQVVLLFKYE